MPMMLDHYSRLISAVNHRSQCYEYVIVETRTGILKFTGFQQKLLSR